MKNININLKRVSKISSSISLLVLLGTGLAVADNLVVSKGASDRVPISSGIKKIIISNPMVVDAKPSNDGQSIVVSGLSEGNSEIRVERLVGADVVTNVVVQTDNAQTLAEIKELLTDVEGLEVKVLGNKIVLKGNILTKSDYDKVTKVVGAYSSSILNMSTFDRTEMNKYVEEAIVKDI